MTSSTATRVNPRARGADWAAGNRFGWRPATRQGVQVSLGVLWLVDALLQLQPFMFTADFARQMLTSAGAGQPAWVAGPVDFFARLIAAHPAPLNAGFALIQFALGIGFLFPPLVRAATVASLAWSAGIWWFGEGLGGLASGQVSLVTGAPGAVLLYAVLAVAAWPVPQDRAPGQEHGAGPARVAVARWLAAAWALLWVGGAVLQLVGGQASAAALRNQIDGADGLPEWLAQAHHLAGAALGHAGSAPLYVLVAVMALVGLAGLGGRPWRTAAAAAGAVAATIFWVLGQNIGQLYSGMATDPGTGPLIVLMALALAGTVAPNGGANNTTRPHQHGAKPPSAPIHDGWGDESPVRTESRERRAADDMSISTKSLFLFMAVPLVLTGCAAAYASHSSATTSMAHNSSSSAGMSMSPGMTMAPGQSMPTIKSKPAAPVAAATSAASPPKSASMICGPETATSVATLMGLHTPPPTKATWADHLYTCTYQLPTGPLVLSVKDSPDVSAARVYFNGRRQALGPTQPLGGLAGLGLPGYQDSNGTVVFLKDNMTLKVDAAALPARVGPQNTTRNDLAYTVATDVLACWTGK